MTPEGEILRDIRHALGREPDLVLWRTTPTPPSAERGQQYRQLPVGWPDLVGVLAPWGRCVMLEVKTARGRVTEEQAQFHQLARSKGAFVAVVRSVEEARTALDLARAESGAPARRLRLLPGSPDHLDEPA